MRWIKVRSCQALIALLYVFLLQGLSAAPDHA